MTRQPRTSLTAVRISRFLQTATLCLVATLGAAQSADTCTKTPERSHFDRAEIVTAANDATEAQEQVRRGLGKDYSTLVRNACSNSTGSIVALAAAAKHTDGAGADDYGFIIWRILHLRGDAAFSAECKRMADATRKQVYEALQSGSGLLDDPCFDPYMAKYFPKTLAVMTGHEKGSVAQRSGSAEDGSGGSGSGTGTGTGNEASEAKSGKKESKASEETANIDEAPARQKAATSESNLLKSKPTPRSSSASGKTDKSGAGNELRSEVTGIVLPAGASRAPDDLRDEFKKTFVKLLKARGKGEQVKTFEYIQFNKAKWPSESAMQRALVSQLEKAGYTLNKEDEVGEYQCFSAKNGENTVLAFIQTDEKFPNILLYWAEIESGNAKSE